MQREEVDNSGTSQPTPGDDFNKSAGSGVNVSITDMHDYAKALFDMSRTFATTSMSALTPLGRFAAQAFPPGSSAGTFWELQNVQQQQQQHTHDMASFFKQLGQGITNISSASQVIADLYAGHDSESAMTLNDLAFAFADPDAKRPKNTPHGLGKTWSDVALEQQEQLGQAGSNAESVANGSFADPMDPNAVPFDEYGKGATSTKLVSKDDYLYQVFTYSDGSQVWCAATYSGGVTHRSTMVYGTDGKLISNREITNTGNAAGDPGTTTVTDRNQDGKVQSSQETVTDKSGAQTITTKDGDGKAVGDPVRVAAPSERPDAPADSGPMRDEIDKSHSVGDEDTQKKYGTGA